MLAIESRRNEILTKRTRKKRREVVKLIVQTRKHEHLCAMPNKLGRNVACDEGSVRKLRYKSSCAKSRAKFVCFINFTSHFTCVK